MSRHDALYIAKFQPKGRKPHKPKSRAMYSSEMADAINVDKIIRANRRALAMAFRALKGMRGKP